MATPHEHPIGEELQRHAGWIRALARSLVADEATAEDVVQDTWVASLTHDPPLGSGLRPWLRRVVHNFARQDFRSRGRRRAREERARGPSPLPEPDELGQRLEMERLLTERLAALAEPFRSTLLLRYYEDLEPAQIARRQGVPGGTVRWRLKRGLELVREGMDESHGGDRGAWCALMLPLARTTEVVAAVAGPTAVVSGALAMNGLLKVGVAAVAVVVLAVGLSRSGWLPATILPWAAEEPLEVTFRPLVEAAPAAPPAPLAEPEAEPPGVARAALPAPDPVASAAAPRAEPVTAGVVEAKVVDTFGSPLAGVRLAVRGTSAPPASGSTGADGTGRLELAIEEPTRVGLELRASGFASRVETLVVRPGETTQAGTLTLGPGGAVRGRVLDTQGYGIAGASVALGDMDVPARALGPMRVDPPVLDVPTCATDARGDFLLLGAPVGHVRLWGQAPGKLASFTPPIEVRPGQESGGVELVLEELRPKNEIRGIVLDPDGRPVPDAPLEYRHRSEEAGRSMQGDRRAASDGTFAFQLPEDARLWITARDPEGRHAPVSASDVGTGELNLVLQLREARSVALEVVGEDGDAVERYAFELLSPDEGFVHRAEPRAPRPEGRASFPQPAEPFVLRVTAPGHLVQTLGPFAVDAPELASGILCRLRPAPGLRGRVLAEGRPLADAEVRLFATVPDDTAMVRNGFRDRIDASARDEEKTDEDGSFLLTVRGEGDFVVRAEHAGYAPGELGPLALGPGLAPAPVELSLGHGGAIEGRVWLAHGEDPTGSIVGISRGDGHPRTRRVGADGRYRFEGLTPGSWFVGLRDEELFAGYTSVSTSRGGGVKPFDEEVEWSCIVYEDETTFHDLRPEELSSYPFEGRLRLDGRPAGAWSARLLPMDTFFLDDAPAVVLDHEGRFTVDRHEPGEFRLVLSASAETGSEHFLLDRVVVPQEEPWDRDLATGELLVDGVPAWDGSGAPTLVYLWLGPGDLRCLTPLAGDASGACLVPDALAGHGRLSVPDLATADRLLDWEVLREVEVPAGGRLEVGAR